VSPDYAARTKAIEDATSLMRDMQTSTRSGVYNSGPFAAPALDRFEVTELARFLLGLDAEVKPDGEVTP
jgi:hypothetical protein